MENEIMQPQINVEEITNEIKSAFDTIKEQIKNESKIDLDFSKTTIHGNDKQVKELFESYASFVGEVENPKNTTVNPFHKSKYAPLQEVLNTVKPVLSKFGLSIIQIPTMSGNKVVVNNMMIHKNGGFITFEGLGINPQKPDAQGVGGAMTYGRRYTLSSLTSVSSEEDTDGNTDIKKDEKTPSKVSPNETNELKSLQTETTSICKELMKDGKDPAETIEKVLGKKIAKCVKADVAKLKKLKTELEKM